MCRRRCGQSGSYNRVLLLISLSLAAASLSLPPVAADEIAAANGAYVRGEQLLRDARWEDAVRTFQQAVQLNPEDPNNWHGVGYALKKMGKFDESLAAYDALLRLDPNFKKAYLNRGEIYFDLGELDLAIRSLTRGIELDPQNERAHLIRSQAHAMAGDLRSARVDVDEAIRLMPTDSQAWQSSSNVWQDMGEFDRAVEDARHAITLNVQSSVAHGCLIQSLIAAGDWGEALRAAELGVATCPEDPRLHAMHACVRNFRGEYMAAMESCKNALAIDPRCQIALYQMGVAKRRLNEFETAIDFFDAVILAYESHAEAYEQRGVCYANLNDHTQAVEDISKALQLGLESKNARWILAHCLFELGDFERAVAIANESIRVSPNDSNAYRIRGAIKLRQSKLVAASWDLNQAIALGSTTETYFERALVRFALDTPDLGLADLRHCLSCDADSPRYHYALAVVLATHPDDVIRNGTVAHRHAIEAIQLYKDHTGGHVPKDHVFCEALAAATAEMGDFENAGLFQDQVAEAAGPSSKKGTQTRLQSYRARQPWREVPKMALNSPDALLHSALQAH